MQYIETLIRIWWFTSHEWTSKKICYIFLLTRCWNHW